jgi:endonuclease/exonuclease/phosphatase family metal-dependent hydrolase
LDVFDDSGETRLKEIDEVIAYLDQNATGVPTIVMGDFNSLKKDDYLDKEIEWLSLNNQNYPLDFQVVDRMESAGFHEVFGKGMFKYSVWSARRIDFIFIRNIDLSRIVSTGVMYTPASDHLPIFVDLNMR